MEEPQLVLLDRAAQSEAAVKNVPDRGHGGEAAGTQRVVQVVALQTLARVEAVGRAREIVGAFLGHHVDHDAVRIGVGRDPARREHRFLHGLLVLVVALAAGRVSDLHAVESDVGAAFAVIRDADGAGVAAGDVEALLTAESGGERHEVVQVLHAARQQVEEVAGHQRLLADVLGVDQRCGARDRDRLLEGANFHFTIHRCREPRR